MHKEKILAELERVASNSAMLGCFDELRSYIEILFSGDATSHIIGYTRFLTVSFKCLEAVSMDCIDTCAALMEQIGAHLRELGYREHILTPQEHKLKGSTCPSEPSYMPEALALSKLDMNDVIRARELERVFRGYSSFIVMPEIEAEDDVVYFSLESLDKEGNTLRDPRPLDGSLEPMTHYTKAANFPFRRD